MHIYNKEQIHQMDAEAAEQGLSPFTLMENAGRGLFEKIIEHIDETMSIGIVAGRGNNGGDGIVLARYLRSLGFNVELMFPIGLPLTETAKNHLSYYKAQGFTVTNWNEGKSFDVIVDSLLGVGTRLPLRENIAHVIRWANEQSALRIAIDLPTGVLANSGNIVAENNSQPLTEPFQADYTFSLHGAKPSAFLYPSAAYYGELEVVTIGLKQDSQTIVLEKDAILRTLPTRKSSGHKGTFGTSLIVAGSDEMPGSVALSAIGAIRSGVGRLIVATCKSALPIVALHVPEATFMTDGLMRISKGEMPEKIASAAIGPGLVDRKTTRRALEQLLRLEIPVVVDAGALEKRTSWQAKGPVIITPHPGEFSRLTGYSVEYIQQNRIQLAQEYAEDHEVIVVLKGEFSVIAFPKGPTFINPTGNTGLAKGGSGDVLTGMLVSFLATYKNVEHAVKNAVYIHGLCANYWVKKYSEAAMTARDFATCLPIVLKELEQELEKLL